MELAHCRKMLVDHIFAGERLQGFSDAVFAIIATIMVRGDPVVMSELASPATNYVPRICFSNRVANYTYTCIQCSDPR